MTNITQLDFIKHRLIKNGKISRNECFREYISRLSALILILKQQGWEFDAKYVKFTTKHGWGGKDYVYTVTKIPEDLK